MVINKGIKKKDLTLLNQNVFIHFQSYSHKNLSKGEICLGKNMKTMYRKQTEREKEREQRKCLHGVCPFVGHHTVDLVDGRGERAKPNLL